MATEIPKRKRIKFGRSSPATCSSSTPEHTCGIAMSKDFMIHSSSQGVYVAPLLEDWRRSEFAWARRVL